MTYMFLALSLYNELPQRGFGALASMNADTSIVPRQALRKERLRLFNAEVIPETCGQVSTSDETPFHAPSQS